MVETCSPIPGANIVSPVPRFVRLVLGVRAPSEVFRSIVEFVAIEVADLIGPRRPLAMECRGDENVGSLDPPG